MKKAVVVGGAGFIGSSVVDEILKDGSWDEVLVIDNLSTGKRENVNSGAKLVVADIRNINEIEPHFKGATHVWHLAALPRVEPSIKDPITFNDINVNGTLNVFMSCRNNGVAKVVFSSSSSVYGEPKTHPTPEDADLNPMSPYALQKLHGEQYAKLFCDLYDMNISCLRYFNVYGKREPIEGFYVPVIGIWLRQLRSGKNLTITGDGKQIRDFVNVEDVAHANRVAALYTPAGYSVYNVGSGKNHELNEVARWICADENKIEYIAPRIEPRLTLADTSKLRKVGQGVLPEPLSLKEYLERELKDAKA
jgi:UDP-glucose 4-epimerase